jgi:RNA polymerase sigma-70 factor, ECF subfamily
MSGWRRPMDTAVAPVAGARYLAMADDADPAGAGPADAGPAAAGPAGAGAAGTDLAAGPADADARAAATADSGGADPGGAEADLAADAAVAGAQQGDPEAFRVLYRDTQPRLLRYLHALVGDDAEDIASETWLHIARDLHTFHGDHDGFRGWAATIARHRALDHLRRHARRPPPLRVPADALASLAAHDDTAATALDAVATTAAVRLIATLPPDQAEAVLLRAVLGLDAARAAAVLGKRPGAVRTAAHRGLRTLARHLDKAGDGATTALPPVLS